MVRVDILDLRSNGLLRAEFDEQVFDDFETFSDEVKEFMLDALTAVNHQPPQSFDKLYFLTRHRGAEQSMDAIVEAVNAGDVIGVHFEPSSFYLDAWARDFMTYIDADTGLFLLLKADSTVSTYQRAMLHVLSDAQGGQLELWFVTRDGMEYRFLDDEQKPIIPWQRFIERIGEPLYYIRIRYHALGARSGRARRPRRSRSRSRSRLRLTRSRRRARTRRTTRR